MVINLVRYAFLGDRTLGMIFIDGIFQCYTLEDTVRDKKIYGETAIPKGQYKVIITYSPTFKKKMPLLLDVVGFEGIRVHKGNYPKDTYGCLLVAERLTQANNLYNSKGAYDKLYKKIEASLNKKKNVFIVISDSSDVF